MRKILFNIFFYLSIIFLGYYLYQLDYFSFREIRVNYSLLGVSIFLLWVGYILSAISWWNILRKHALHVSIPIALSSHGLSIFAKYIPGKIWVILGRAGYVSNLGYPLKTTSYLSLKEQLIYVWEGLTISAVPMVFFFGINGYTIAAILLCAGLTLFLFTRYFHNQFLLLLRWIFRKEFDIPYVSLKDHAGIIGYVFVYWIVWLVAYYFLIWALHDRPGFEVAFAFPLSVTIGLLAIVAPGGLGVRESIMTAYLTLAGIPLTLATAMTIYARIWFITGEIFIFLLGAGCRLYIRNKD